MHSHESTPYKQDEIENWKDKYRILEASRDEYAAECLNVEAENLKLKTENEKLRYEIERESEAAVTYKMKEITNSKGKCSIQSWCDYFIRIGFIVACIIIIWQETSDYHLFQPSKPIGDANWVEEEESRSVGERKSFCLNGRLLPSILGVGTQKCGTTTMDYVLSKFDEIDHGFRKEHHFFDDDRIFAIPDETGEDLYAKRFAQCSDGYEKSFEFTGNYSNPRNNAINNIRTYYDKLNLPTEDIVFITMICDPRKRLESAWYMQTYKYYLGHKDNPEMHKFNYWVKWVNKHRSQDGSLRDPNGIFSRGYYDEILQHWFEVFPNNKFIIINSYYAYEHEQEVGDIIARVTGLPSKNMKKKGFAKNVGKNPKEPREESTDNILYDIYHNHTAPLVELLQSAAKKDNIFLVPEDGFIDGWLLDL